MALLLPWRSNIFGELDNDVIQNLQSAREQPVEELAEPIERVLAGDINVEDMIGDEGTDLCEQAFKEAQQAFLAVVAKKRQAAARTARAPGGPAAAAPPAPELARRPVDLPTEGSISQAQAKPYFRLGSLCGKI